MTYVPLSHNKRHWVQLQEYEVRSVLACCFSEDVLQASIALWNLGNAKDMCLGVSGMVRFKKGLKACFLDVEVCQTLPDVLEVLLSAHSCVRTPT